MTSMTYVPDVFASIDHSHLATAKTSGTYKPSKHHKHVFYDLGMGQNLVPL